MNSAFKNGFLYKFESSDGLRRAAKEMKTQNPDYFDEMTSYAKQYWGEDNASVLQELNIQVEALYSIPDGFRNKHLNEFHIDGDLYNFKMLNILYYGGKITLREFKDICHDEVEYLNRKKSNGKTIYYYLYKRGVYAFLEDGNLIMRKPIK